MTTHFRSVYRWMAAAVIAFGLGQTLWAVEYGGEKSFLVEIPYKVCATAPLPKEAETKGIKPISAIKAKELFDDGAHFYDARRKAQYNLRHIEGALPVLFDLSKAEYTVLNLPKDSKTPVVFYCYGESCANSYEVALAVREHGYQNVYWFSGGYVAWERSGYPTQP